MQTATSFATGHQAHMAYLMITVLRDSLSPKVDLSHSRGLVSGNCAGQFRAIYQPPFFCPACRVCDIRALKSPKFHDIRNLHIEARQERMFLAFYKRPVP